MTNQNEDLREVLKFADGALSILSEEEFGPMEDRILRLLEAFGIDLRNKETAVRVGSHWMCRLFVTTGDWKEVEVLETNVERKGILKHRVQLVSSPKSARFYVEEKYLNPMEDKPQ